MKNFKMSFIRIFAIIFTVISISCSKQPYEYKHPDIDKNPNPESRITKYPTDFLPYIGKINWVGNLASDAESWTENWIDDSSGTTSIQYKFENGSLRFWTEKGSKQRPKVMHKNRKIFTTGEYKWKVYIPKMGMYEKISVGAFLYHDGDHELDFEIGSGTKKNREKYQALDDEVLMYLTSQEFPSHQFIHPIKTEAWYDLTIRLTETEDKKYYLEWLVNGYLVDAVKLEYGKEIPFGIHCSLENLEFMGDSYSSREHYALFEKMGFESFDSSYEEPLGSKTTIITSKQIGEEINIRVDAEESEQHACWIDLNNNRIKDSNESITKFGDNTSYTIGNQEFTIYGIITRLDCMDNQLTALDVGEQTALFWLDCGGNEIRTLDLSKNSELIRLRIDGNSLTGLDLSLNSKLEYLSCEGGFSAEVTTLDVNQNTKLEFMDVSENRLTTLNVNSNTKLTFLNCNSNALTGALNVSNNTESLEELRCANNQLTELNISNKNSNLKKLRCDNNQINGVNMTNLVNLLPPRSGRDGELFIINTASENEGNMATAKDVSAAKNKGWKVLDRNGNIEYPGS